LELPTSKQKIITEGTTNGQGWCSHAKYQMFTAAVVVGIGYFSLCNVKNTIVAG
jgi:hypothetical protein